jgi:AcrR family transcriptional regulator
MPDQISEVAAEQPRGADTKKRILAAAGELFYTRGIRATSADRIIEQVGVTKVTFYRHFRSKSELVVAYLRQWGAQERAWMEGLLQVGDAFAVLRAVADGIGDGSCRPGFRGCAFINAAAEFADPADPVREAVDAHRRWMRGFFSRIALDAGAASPTAVAEQLMMLRDGALVGGYLGDPSILSEALGTAFKTILASATPPSPLS